MASQDLISTNGKRFVLVHGAFHGAWCWSDVAAQLRELGYKVDCPTLTGLGERSHLIQFDPSLEIFINDVVNLLHYEDASNVVLVGHSFAGSIISAVADRIPERLRHLVFLDAAVLRSGQCPADMPSPEVLQHYKQRSFKLSSGVTVLPSPAPAAFGITDPKQAAWMEARLTPHPFRTYFDKLELKYELGNGIPATYIACTNPLFANTASARLVAKAMPGWIYQEIPTAHNAMMLMPRELSEMLAAID